jgi:hypothetical protein
MPRTKRTYVPGAIAHVISRFVNREYRIEDDRQRAEFLRRTGIAAERFDWRILAYAIMSTHIHWAMLVGKLDLDCFTRSLHTGFAGWLNHRQHREGPLFAQRPKVIQMPVQHSLRLLCYVHNNPCRAGVVDDALESSWTSHRHYVGARTAPAWLDLETGFMLCDLTRSASRGTEFDTYVRAHRGDPRDPVLSGDELELARRALRRKVGPVAELGTPFLEDPERTRHTFLAPAGALYREQWSGTLALILQLACRYAAVDLDELRSASRKRTVTRARKIVLLAAVTHLRRPLVEIAGALGIASQSASELIRRAEKDPELDRMALAVARACVGLTTENPPSET